MKLGILTSGRLGFEVLSKVVLSYNVVYVLTDKNSSQIIAYCYENNLPVYIGNPNNGKSDSFLDLFKPDVIFSINYIFLIDTAIYTSAKKVALNIHGSLLPKYRGRSPHVWAIINNETETGITIHKIDSGCDTGDIVRQVKVPILYSDTGNDILSKYEKLYFELIDNVLKEIQVGQLKSVKQDNTLATFFPKREPKDGLINWDWQKERIYNWVRAQAFPYPGAYSFLQGKKCVIDVVSFSDIGFEHSEKNGKILCVKPLVIKASNGAIEINSIRNHNIEFSVGQVFSNYPK